MELRLGPNRYGKAEVRVVAVRRHADRHELTDLNVSVALAGSAMDETHLRGDNAAVLTTDAQKNTVFAFARKHGVDQIEDFALLLARHFVDSQPTIEHARVEIEEYAWDRIEPEATKPATTTATAHRHSFVRRGQGTRTCLVHYDGTDASIVSGIADLVVLNSTGSEFWGFLRDEYTTLEETWDRVLATTVNARWRHRETHEDWKQSYEEARRHLLEAFADTKSLSLQQTLYAMGGRVLENRPELCEIRLSLPNRHHFLVDLSPFGLENGTENSTEGAVYFAADRPYGLIEGTVLCDDAPAPARAWE